MLGQLNEFYFHDTTSESGEMQKNEKKIVAFKVFNLRHARPQFGIFFQLIYSKYTI